MESDVFGLSNTKHLCRNAQSCIRMHWGNDVANLPPQNLTQKSGPLTRLVSDLGWARQKYDCMIHILSSLHLLLPQMKEKHGLNEEKNFHEE
jgi:hypothetical protein